MTIVEVVLAFILCIYGLAMLVIEIEFYNHSGWNMVVDHVGNSDFFLRRMVKFWGRWIPAGVIRIGTAAQTLFIGLTLLSDVVVGKPIWLLF